ncbi:type I-G CRISPR-associated RAMP protein Csb1/Cas7g [Saccharopolyspora hattusasensis]|uniref:type I-G CRISPR-associated RAMP protein Csb1/Cas7g n=1 Tax=Saccharopolyspora hattusasensis TaxID=1128679 RepID=UPI003D97A7D0
MTDARTILNVALRPVAGSRFQPTGFPDLGAAEFDAPARDGRSLLVESVQSMANRLEEQAWDAVASAPRAPFDRLPWVRVSHAEDARFLTSSRIEAHRLASAYIRHGQLPDGTPGMDFLHDALGLQPGRPLDRVQLTRAVFRLDPFSLLHGVFFAISAWPWQPRVQRAVTAFIEAHNVRPAVSGGVKRELVRNKNEAGTDDEPSPGADTGYGSIPHQRIEYTAETILLSVVIDKQQFRSYGLSPEATELLHTLAQWELRSLLNSGLRLRTACDLITTETIDLPDLDELTARIDKLVDVTADEHGGTTHDITWTSASAKTQMKRDKSK